MKTEACKILIVDDEELNLLMLSRLLSCDNNFLYTAGMRFELFLEHRIRN